MSIEKNPFTASATSLMVTNIGGFTVMDMVNTFNRLLDDNAPEGKTRNDFTGGYIQQMANSNQLVLYFGYKWDNEKEATTKNRDTVKIDIDATDMDAFYIGLKAKIVEMKFNSKKSGKNKKVSFADIFSGSKVSEATILDTAKAIPNRVCDENSIIPLDVEYEDDDVCNFCRVPISHCICDECE